MSTINSVNNASYFPQVSASPQAATTLPNNKASLSPDQVQLSLAGRIALGVSAGKLTSDQATQLESQLQTITQQLKSGDTSGVGQLQQQLSESIYGDTHNGAAIPADLTVTTADQRVFEQAGRIAYQENAGNLTSTQGSQFLAQVKQIYQQSQNGASGATTNQAQNELSLEIYDAAHNITQTTPLQPSS